MGSTCKENFEDRIPILPHGRLFGILKPTNVTNHPSMSLKINDSRFYDRQLAKDSSQLVCKSLGSNWTTLVRTSHFSSKAEEKPTHAIVFHIYIIQYLPRKELNKRSFYRQTFVGVLGISSARCLHTFDCRDRYIQIHRQPLPSSSHNVDHI